MKKIWFFCILFLMLALLPGCGDADAHGEFMQESDRKAGTLSGDEDASETGSNSKEGFTDGEKTQGASTQGTDVWDGSDDHGSTDNTDNRDNADSQDNTDTSAEYIVPGTAKKTLNGSSGTISCLGSGRLLLAGEKMILMDGITLEIQTETENRAPLLVYPQTLPVGDGCMMLGVLFEGPQSKLVEYDGELQVKRIMDVEEVSSAEREIMSCRLLSDGNRILYNNINGFYLFDFTSGETNDLTQEDLFIYNFACLEAKGEILFSGSDASGKRILGRMDMDGKGMQIEDREHLWGELWGFGDFALADEAELVGKEKEGAVFRYDEQGIHSFPLTDSDENGNITVSCGGGYYGTRTNVQDTALRCYVRIYSSKDGSLVKELPLSYEEYGENFRLGGYLICDDMQRVVLYGTWRGRETESWIVSVNM